MSDKENGDHEDGPSGITEAQKSVTRNLFHSYLFKLLNHVWSKTPKFEILKKKGTYLLVMQIAEEVC